MRVTRDAVGGFWQIAALDKAEDKVLRPLIKRLQKGASFLYGGRRDDPDGKFIQVIVNAGGESKRKTEKIGKCTLTRDVIEGGVTVALKGTSEEDKHALFQLRDCLFHGSAPLRFKDGLLDGNLASFRIPGKPCKHCGALMVTMSRCEWSTCKTCAAKCQHVYQRGIVHGGGTDIGMGEYCQLCGLGKPKAEGEREKSVLEHHLAVQRETGGQVRVVYTNGPPITPEQTVAVTRVARRYKRSKSRSGKHK